MLKIKNMKKIIVLILVSFLIIGCRENNVKDSDNKMLSLNIIIDNKDYIINLEDNETVKEFVNILPQKFVMNELNGNEKYVYLDNYLTVNPINVNTINAGDVMIYGNNCLVIFYKTFNTSYKYTKIGHIDNLPNLGNSNVNVEIK